ncbi:hypothetical protein H0H81_006255 [Sphagnurus paluster]|uniref:Gamma-glutamylcyclotransferase AIG2-like domain-containing protein n=1 Tax=Sphagnurus paluster TaxID=117069 RepID=A0A9P7GL76_9AGAR|nr:hypothetical protein H0H81_006255 [Sphagnurus paluster]
MSSAFFYGTLMHPKVLQRVIKHDGAQLHICPAVLLVRIATTLIVSKGTSLPVPFCTAPHTNTTTNAQRAEYPGMIPYDQTRVLCGRDLEPEERSVRGTLVTGLSARDMHLLDIFEGSEYIRKPVSVHPLARAVALCDFSVDEMIPATPPPLPAPEELAPPVEAGTYVFVLPQRLEPALWSFEEFVLKNAHKWYGEQPPDEDVRWAELDAEGA